MRFLIAVALSLLASLAAAQKPLTFMLASSVGSTSDTALRALQPAFESELKRPVVIANVPGALGLLAMQKYMALPPDGDTVFIGTTALAFMKHARNDLTFDPMADITPVHAFVGAGHVLLASPRSGISKVADIRALAAKNGRVTYGSTSFMTDMIAMQIERQLGVKVEIVRYKEMPQMFNDIASGEVDMSSQTVGSGSVAGLIAQGKLTPVAVLGDKRVEGFATPTMKEQGFKRVEDFGWGGFFVHAATPLAAKRSLEQALVRVLSSEAAAQYTAKPGNPKVLWINAAQLRELQFAELALIREFSQPGAAQ